MCVCVYNVLKKWVYIIPIFFKDLLKESDRDQLLSCSPPCQYNSPAGPRPD